MTCRRVALSTISEVPAISLGQLAGFMLVEKQKTAMKP